MARRIVRQIAVIGGALLVAPTVQSQVAPNSPKAPDALRPPEHEQLLFHLRGQGDQIYVCQNAPDGYAWKLKAPNAKLYAESGELAGRHFAGPTWEAHDGSRVVGKIAASVPSTDAGSIPWLLLTITSREGAGVMSKVHSVQRLNTKGGIAPTSGCDAADANHESAVPYSAEYYFYGQPPA